MSMTDTEPFQCKDCGAEYCYHGSREKGICADCMWFKHSNLKHIGYSAERCETKNGYPEKIYQLEWQNECKRKRGINNDYGALDLLIGKASGIHPTERDAAVAATVIQWLGTNIGSEFVDRCQRLIEKERAERKKYDDLDWKMRSIEKDLRGNSTAIGFAILSMA